jgi:glycosyltransferase involved in cell wall biosynthesis
MIEPGPRARVVLVGPTRRAVGGISTHVNQLLGSTLAESAELLHFPVGSDGLPEVRLKMLVRLATSPLSFVRFLIARRPNVVHLNTSMVPKAFWRDSVYFFIARMLRCKVIYQVHGGALPHEFYPGSPFLNRLLARILCASEVVVLLAQVELAAYRRFVPTARLKLIANAIDTDDSLARGAIAEKPEGTLHLAYMGRLIEEKGIFDAVEALAVLAREKRAVTLSIAGSGPQEAQLRARVADLGLDDRVHFLGPLFDAPKEALWRAAHIFVFPTYFLEGLPYALLEAMAAGAVPVTTRVGAIPDVLEDGVHGLLVPVREPAVLAAAIARLDDDRRSLVRMAEAGRRRVAEHYTLARLADDFRKLYASMV